MARKILSLLFLGLTFAFGFFYYVQYFKWRDCFNELGGCFDANTGVVYLEQSGAIWLTATVLAFAAFLFQVWRVIRRRR